MTFELITKAHTSYEVWAFLFDLFLQTRKIVLSYERIVETKKRITTYSNEKGGICHIRTMPYSVNIGFVKGVQMDDKYEVLIGKVKAIRVLPKKGSLDKEVLKYFIIKQ